MIYPHIIMTWEAFLLPYLFQGPDFQLISPHRSSCQSRAFRIGF